jgi:UDP-3-O-[3-hydroxymyristoyl] glucosamine N-acyltransferase
VKVGNLVQIAHNTDIGAGTLVIGGSVRIGERCWIAPSVVIKENLTIGDGAFLGIGSVVIRDVEPGAIVFGNPDRLSK